MSAIESDASGRICMFCGETIASKDPPEHVIPKWMRRFRPKDGWFASGPGPVLLVGEIPNTVPDRPAHLSKQPDITTTVVCKTCNHDWMSDLETRASQIMDPMVRGDDRLPLSIQDQAWLAAWGIKTAMMWMTMLPGRYLIPLAHYQSLRTHKLPPPDYRVRLGRYDAIGRRLAWSFFVPAVLRDMNHPEPARTDTHRSVLVFGHLVFEITGPMQEGFRHPSPPLDSGTFLLDIWPGGSPRPLSWPPTHTFDEDEMFRFAGVSPEAELPNPGAE